MTEDRDEGFQALEALTALEDLAGRLQAACLARGVWVATAESCTGGLVAHAITQVAGSYGGIAYMVIAVLFILVQVALFGWPCSIYLWHEFRHLPIGGSARTQMAACVMAALVSSVVVFLLPMRRGVRALERLAD